MFNSGDILETYELEQSGMGIKLTGILGAIGGAIAGDFIGSGLSTVGTSTGELEGAAIGAAAGGAILNSSKPLVKATSMLVSAATGYVASGFNPLGAIVGGVARGYAGGSQFGLTTFGIGAASGVVSGLVGPAVGVNPSFSNPIGKMYASADQSLGLTSASATPSTTPGPVAGTSTIGGQTYNIQPLSAAPTASSGWSSAPITLPNGQTGMTYWDADGNTLSDAQGNPVIYSGSVSAGPTSYAGTSSGAQQGDIQMQGQQGQPLYNSQGQLVGYSGQAGQSGSGSGSWLQSLLGAATSYEQGQNQSAEQQQQLALQAQEAAAELASQQAAETAAANAAATNAANSSYGGGGGASGGGVSPYDTSSYVPVSNPEGIIGVNPDGSPMTPDQVQAAQEAQQEEAMQQFDTGMDPDTALMLGGALFVGFLVFSKAIHKSKSKR
jgi:hypothetical protein